VCMPSLNPGCALTALAKPLASVITSSECMGKGGVVTGTQCDFRKEQYTCSSATCTAGSWSAPTCVLLEPGCMFKDLQMPVGAHAYGHANCAVDATTPVPSGAAGCMISKDLHTCSAANCLAGTWDTPICVRSLAPSCDLNDLPIPENAAIATDTCRTGWNIPSGGSCQFSKIDHVCSSATCLAGEWSPASCVIEPVVRVGCLFSTLQVPPGASASGHANCHPDATDFVFAGLSCILNKPGHLCSAAMCMDEDGTWSGTECYPSTDPECPVSNLVSPDGAEISTDECLTGSLVPSGAMCEFTKLHHVCSAASCVAGSWSTSSCAPVSSQGCLFSELQLPSGATGYGHEYCNRHTNAPVPAGAAACMLSKPGHICTAATCLPDGSWSQPLCVPDADPPCALSALVVPGGATIITEECVSAAVVASGGVCEFTKPDHTCSAASCMAGTWSPATCVEAASCEP
jgi:hypothetical protein